MRARVRVATAVGAGALVAVTLAACTSDGGTTTDSSAPASSSSAPATSAAPTTSAPPTTGPTGSPTTASPTASPTTSTSTSPTTPALAACAALDVAVTRVPGAAGVTYGLVTVTSRESARCSLPGIPSLRLLDSARSPVTAVATAITVSQAVTALDPGGVASTLLEDRSDTCQANTRSAFVEVQATPAAAKVVAALSLPPCSLSVKPFTPGAQPAP